jgi:cytochrome c oxidase subunit 1
MRERPAYLRTSMLWAALTALSLALAAVPAAPTPAMGGATLRDTYYVVSPFSHALPFSAVFAAFAAFYFWCERAWSNRYDNRLGQLQLGLTALGFALVSSPRFFLAYIGEPRRYVDYPAAFQAWNYASSAGYLLVLVGLLAFAAVCLRGMWIAVRVEAH